MESGRARKVAAAIAAAGAGAAVYATLVEPRRLQVTWWRIGPRHTRGAPGAGSASGPSRARPGTGSCPLVLGLLSDLHLSRLGSLHCRVARAVREARPHALLIAGDAVDQRRHVEVLDRFLALLDPAVPKVAVMGNWEYRAGVDPGVLSGAYRRWNGTLLVNRSILLSHVAGPIRVSGVDDLVEGRPDLGEAVAGTAGSCKEDPPVLHILLSHCPEYRDRLPAAAGRRPGPGAGYREREGRTPVCAPPDYVLAGHTHGGSVRLPGLRFLPRGSGGYVSGWYEDGPVPMYVSRGLGTSVIPVRLGSPPEATFFEFDLVPCHPCAHPAPPGGREGGFPKPSPQEARLS